MTAFAIGAPGYSQVKFNVLNYHIIHNSKDRKPGIVTGVVCGFLFFFSLSDEMMKILPRSGACLVNRFIDFTLG